MKKKWKSILIAIVMLPILVFFPGCSCSKEDDSMSTTNPNQFTVFFYTGTSETFNIPNQVVNEGNLVRRPDNPTWSGHVFLGWYEDTYNEGWQLLWNFNVNTVTKNITLHARWDE